jgi:hypothetical protein
MSITSTAPATARAVNGHGQASSCPLALASATPSPRPSQHRGVIQELRNLDAAERRQISLSASTLAAGGFSPEQVAALAAPLDRSCVSSREQGRGRVNYLQSWVVIQEANRIFGFDGWQRQTISCHCVTQAERLIGREQKPGWGVTYTARVRITVQAGARGLLIREGTGAGHGIDTDLGLAHESAIKEAETDAMKRALVTFGNPFGLALYDKSQRQVSHAAAPVAASRSPVAAPQRTAEEARPTQAPGNGVVRHQQAVVTSQGQGQGPVRVAGPSSAAAQDAPLDPAAIQALQERIRGLLPPQLAAFSQAFRSAFHVPAEIPSIAGLITDQHHQLWIEDFLSRLQSQHEQAPTL